MLRCTDTVTSNSALRVTSTMGQKETGIWKLWPSCANAPVVGSPLRRTTFRNAPCDGSGIFIQKLYENWMPPRWCFDWGRCSMGLPDIVRRLSVPRTVLAGITPGATFTRDRVPYVTCTRLSCIEQYRET